MAGKTVFFFPQDIGLCFICSTDSVSVPNVAWKSFLFPFRFSVIEILFPFPFRSQMRNNNVLVLFRSCSVPEFQQKEESPKALVLIWKTTRIIDIGQKTTENQYELLL